MSGELDVVLSEFCDVLDGSVGKYNGGEACIGVEDEAKPVSFKPYHVPDAMKEQVKVVVEQLVSQGWAEDTDSPWGAPIGPVPNPDDAVRLCVDYRGLNKVALPRFSTTYLIWMTCSIRLVNPMCCQSLI